MSSNLRYLATTLAFTLLAGWEVAEAQLRYPRPFPNPYGYRFAEPESNLRIDVTPREASVYVDGYLAGTVDDFDGVFQRLHVTPGEHELTIYSPGYRTIHQKLYLSPNASRKITENMEKLGPGETIEPPPTAPQPPTDQARRVPPRDRYPFPGRGGQRPPRDPSQPEAPQPPRPPESSSAVGSLVLRVQPADADVIIDGEHWRGPSGDERLVVQVSEGRHQIEVRKDGYLTFSTNVEVRRRDSLPINVSLVRE